LYKERAFLCRSHGRSIASLPTCADFISEASAGNEEFTRTQELKILLICFYFRISESILHL